MNICALALVLLLDVSSSVTPERYNLQKQGLLMSFQDPSIQRLMLSQTPGGMAITVFEWSTTAQQSVPWHHIQTQDDLDTFIVQVAAMERPPHDGITAIGTALDAGIGSLETTPCVPERKVLDVSGDGANNSGIAPAHARDRAQTQGITINGLPILNENEPGLEDHYRTQVVTMDGFVIPSEGFEDFARALRRKLLLEIAGSQ